jgi:hypothetical protein
MKRLFVLFLGLLSILGCSKDEVISADNPSYYQPQGNLLILQVGNEFEGAYEFQLNTISLINDSLQIAKYSNPNELHPNSYWKLLPNDDILFLSSSYEVNFGVPMISKDSLQFLFSAFTLDTSSIQLISTSQINLTELCLKIANLAIVKSYRLSLPNSKIGLARIIMQELNDENGLMIPVEKYLFFLVR